MHGEPFEAVTPVTERLDDIEPADVSEWDREDFHELTAKSNDELVELGLQPWDSQRRLWLFPAEWYEDIPEGLTVSTISGETIQFVPGQTDDDRRFGALAYGVDRGA